jgi:hypothetical protein
MANLQESAVWEAGIYQLEQNDPVVGGVPNLAQQQGFDNVPHLQLANRTVILKQAVDALTAAVANIDVSGQIQAAIAGLVDSAPEALNTLSELADAIQSNDGEIATVLTEVAASLKKADNLADLPDPAQARANLGVGSGGVPDVLVRGEGAPDMGSVQLTAGVFNTMRLTNLALNSVSAGLSTNQISLPAGSYYAKFVVPVAIRKSDSVDGLSCRLFNVTDNLTATPGQAANGGDWQTLNLTGAGTFTLADTKTLEVQVFASEAGVWEGDGWPGGGETQICTILEIWKIPR